MQPGLRGERQAQRAVAVERSFRPADERNRLEGEVGDFAATGRPAATCAPAGGHR